MKSFLDKKGRQWEITINVTAIKRVRSSSLGVNLLEIAGGELIDRLIADPILLCDVIYVLCKAQADERGVTDEQFGEQLVGDPIAAATRALLEEMTDFFGSPRERAILKTVLEKTYQTMERKMEFQEKRLESGIVEKMMERQLRKIEERMLRIVSEPSGNVPASSELTPAP